MKKILFILMMLVCGFASAQVSFIGQATTAQRDGLTIPVGRYAVLYNSTTGQFERWNGSSWERWTAGVTTGDITDGTIDILDLDAALQTSVGLADTSTQPGDNISTLTNDSGFLSSLNGVTSANITDGTIDELDLDTSVNASLDLADSAVQSADIDTFAEIDAIVADKSLVNTADAQTLTNKTIAFGSNTLTNVASTNTSQTISGNKTFSGTNSFTSGLTISGATSFTTVNPTFFLSQHHVPAARGTDNSSVSKFGVNASNQWYFETSPASSFDLLFDATGLTAARTLTFPDTSGEVTLNAGTQTLTNKTISGASNTITNIGSSSILNDAINSNKIQNGTIDILDTDAGIQASLGLADTALQSTDIDTYTELNTTVADVTLTHNGLIDTSSEIAAIVTDETGSGSLVFSNSPTFVTPALGTPSSGVGTNITGIVSSNVTYDNTISGLAATNVKAAIDENAEATISTEQLIVPSNRNIISTDAFRTLATNKTDSLILTVNSGQLSAGEWVKILNKGTGFTAVEQGTIAYLSGEYKTPTGAGESMTIYAAHADSVYVLNPSTLVAYTPATPPTDLFPTGNAASSDDANAVTGWSGSSGQVSVSSITSTDTDNFSIKVESIGTTTNRFADIDVTGLNLTPHTATIRIRREGSDGFVGNWSGVTSQTYNNLTDADFDSAGTAWVTRTVTFTPTTGTVGMRFYINGGAPATGEFFEIAYITVTEN